MRIFGVASVPRARGFTRSSTAPGVRYAIDESPYDACLAALPERPALLPTPWRQNGYVATWAIVHDALYSRSSVRSRWLGSLRSGTARGQRPGSAAS